MYCIAFLSSFRHMWRRSHSIQCLICWNWKKLYACFLNWLNCPVESGYACGCSKPIFRLFWFPHKLLYLHCLLCSRLVSCRANAQVLNSTCIFPCWNVSALLDNDNDNGNWNTAFSGIKMTPSRVWALKLSLSKEKKNTLSQRNL